MNSKIISCAFAGAASLLAAPSLFASYDVIGTGTVNISAPAFSAPYGFDQAGPYYVQTPSVTSGQPLGSFQTFCIASQVNYVPNPPPNAAYNYEVSTTIQPGSSQPANFDYVTWGVAYLYNKFNTGMAGYNGSVSAETPAEFILNDALQAAIWTLQGQSLSGITFYNGTSAVNLNASEVTGFLSDAELAAGGTLSDAQRNANGYDQVYAFNMYDGTLPDGSPNYLQSQLCQLPEPTTLLAGALLVLPFGASTVRFLRRKNRPA